MKVAFVPITFIKLLGLFNGMSVDSEEKWRNNDLLIIVLSNQNNLNMTHSLSD